MSRKYADRRLTRPRAYMFAVAVIATIILLQLITSVTGAVVASRQFEKVAIDTFEYVGELTAERVARFAEAAKDVAEATASEIEIVGADVDRGTLEFSLYQRLNNDPSVRAVYVGWTDGEFLVLQRESDGFQSQRGGGEHGPQVTTRLYDETFALQSADEEPSDYDPRTRPWYTTGATAPATRWSQPFLDYFGGTTLVSAARAARESDDVAAVVGADLDLQELSDVLDGLPYGAGAEAFVLTQQLQIIAAPTSYRERIQAVQDEKGVVARAPDIGLGIDPVLVGADTARFSRDFDQIILDRAFPADEGLPWRLHIRASDQELSAGLGTLATIVLVGAVFSLVMVVIAAGVMWWVRRPINRMHERATTDALTGLLNRSEFYRRGHLIAERAVERGDVVMVTVLDLDEFKGLNDTYGHDAGDKALIAVAAGISGAARAGDLSARMGGDEFAILHVLKEGDRPLVVAQRVRDAIEQEIHSTVDGAEGVGVTAGYATAGIGVDEVGILITLADKALVAGKQVSKGRVYASGEAFTDVDRRRSASSEVDGEVDSHTHE